MEIGNRRMVSGEENPKMIFDKKLRMHQFSIQGGFIKPVIIPCEKIIGNRILKAIFKVDYINIEIFEN